jgi:chorismate-pyruvate lyase
MEGQRPGHCKEKFIASLYKQKFRDIERACGKWLKLVIRTSKIIGMSKTILITSPHFLCYILC